MPHQWNKFFKPVLDPTERVTEILFGLIMVLATTCSFSIGGSGQTDVRQMLIGALGCSIAWGVIDAVIYLMSCFSERGQNILALIDLRNADPTIAYRAITDAMPPLLASVTTPAELEPLRLRLVELPKPPGRPHLTARDWLGALGVFLLVVGATLPVIAPFLFVDTPPRAVRISNAVAIAMLFVLGLIFGRHAGDRPARMGFVMVALGAALVALTIALGG